MGGETPSQKKEGQLQRAEGGQGRDDKSAHSVGRLTSDAVRSHEDSACRSTKTMPIKKRMFFYRL